MPGYSLAPIDRSRIDKKNLCPKCDGLLREAVQTIACGHRYCKTCVDIILRYICFLYYIIAFGIAIITTICGELNGLKCRTLRFPALPSWSTEKIDIQGFRFPKFTVVITLNFNLSTQFEWILT